MIRQLLLFCTLFLFFSVTGMAQTFFYIEASISDPKPSPVTYYTLLHIEPDGTTTARVRYVKAGTNEKMFVEQRFTEQVDTASILPQDDLKKYLIPASKATFLGEAEDAEFIQLRIVCVKKTDSLGAFYEPVT
ncbi:MAG TPA: hypothetical protein VF610_03665, partial [Segetibacter sp.]